MKICTPLIFLCAQLIITWYGYFMGKLSNPSIAELFIVQLKFFWVPIIINMLYGIGFQWGNSGYQNFIIIISLWIATGPIAAIIFNTIVIKEPIDIPIIAGMCCILIGSLLVVAHNDIAKFLP